MIDAHAVAWSSVMDDPLEATMETTSSEGWIPAYSSEYFTT